MNRRWASLALMTALLPSTLLACGGDDDDSGSATPSGSAVAGADNIPSGAPEMDQDNLTFKPNKLSVHVGDKVYVKNSESALHTFNVNGKNVSGNMKKGAVVVWEAPAAGSYKITCEYHPQMNATITVE